MPPILGSLSPLAIRLLRHRLARPSSLPAPAPSSIVPNAATPTTVMTPSRRNLCNYRKCRKRYDWLTWRVLPVLALLFCYSQHKQNKRISKLKESLAELNSKEKENKNNSCRCAPPATATTATAATTTSHPIHNQVMAMAMARPLAGKVHL